MSLSCGVRGAQEPEGRRRLNALPTLTARPWPRSVWALLLLALSLATILLHGFHPFAEDGGLYAAGVEYTLDPSLFPHDTAFVTGHLRFSLFAPSVALLVHLTHLSLPSALLLLDFLAAFATLAAARAILRRCTTDERAQLASLALLAAGWTLPIAGTSLYLMDPYVTARSLSMPFCLAALAFALDPWPQGLMRASLAHHPVVLCAACLLVAAGFHPLMAAYALLFVAALRASSSRHPVTAWFLLASAALLSCGVVQHFTPAESPAEKAAVITRYYWFLSKWQWYERLGLLGPVIMLGLVLRWEAPRQRERVRTLARSAILLGALCTTCALLFAHESSAIHGLARLQPLRAFLLLYAVMLLLLGTILHSACSEAAQTARAAGKLSQSAALRAVPILAAIGMALGLFFAARAIYPASPHVELPPLASRTSNLWVQAFVWARRNTPPDALFALDARYVNTSGEDAQTFRALSLRSALPDYSKDGGEASLTPSLAPAWLAGSAAQQDLSTLPDPERDRRLQPFGVTWMVLGASADTAHPCPYRNAAVKVCRMRP